jgi:hypothetical protein
MTYSDRLRAEGTLSIAAPGMKCQGNTPYSGSSFTCAGDEGSPADAVHTWEGRHYCAYHSPFDLTPEDRAELDARTEPAEGMTWCTRCGKVQVPAATSIDIDPVCADCYLIISTRE